MWNSTAATLNMTEINLIGNQVPEWVELIPAGEVIGRDGRHWINNGPPRIIQAFIASGLDLPVDIEHSTELKAPKGEAAPAFGWVSKLKEIAGAIWGRIEWNEAGRQIVATRQYRYLSPVIKYGRTNGEILALTSVALTNMPNLHLPALNHQAYGSDLTINTRALNATERAICSMMGVTEEEYLKTATHTNDQAVATTALNATERAVCSMMGVTEEEYLKMATHTNDQAVATTALNATERAVCSMMGVTEEEYLKTARSE